MRPSRRKAGQLFWLCECASLSIGHDVQLSRPSLYSITTNQAANIALFGVMSEAGDPHRASAASSPRARPSTKNPAQLGAGRVFGVVGAGSAAPQHSD